MKTNLLVVFAFLAFQISSAKVVVDPVAPSLSPLTYCDPNNDGFGIFDLTELNSQILTAQSGIASDYVITYHGTPDDANTGANPITSPYFNITPSNQIVYYRIENINTNSYANGSVALIVNPTPVATQPVDYHLCDFTGAVSYESFNLTTVIPEVLGTINPSGVSVTFYTNQANAESGFSPIINDTSFVNATIWQQTVYVRVEIVSTGCYDVVPLDLIVDPIPQSIQPNYPPYFLCDFTGTIGSEVFDLTSRVSLILLGQTGMNVTFYPSLGDAQNNTNVITNPSAYVNQVIYVQTLGIRIANQATGCYVLSTMDIGVSPLPQLVAPSGPYTICDANQDGTAVFDLTSLIPDLLSGASYTITFHETLNDAEVFGTTIPNPSSYTNINPFTQTIYVRGADNLTGCATILPIELEVNPAPVAPIVSSLAVCDTDANPQDGTTIVDLTVQVSQILAVQTLPPSNYEVSFYSNQSSAETGMSQLIPSAYMGTNGQTMWYRVESNTTQCYTIGTFQLIVSAPFAVTTPGPLSVCDDDANPNDQFVTFNLTLKDTEINQNHPNYLVTYYPSLAFAQAGTNPIATPTAYTNMNPAIQTLGVRVTTPSGCISITTLDIRVLPIPAPNTNPPALTPQCDVNNPGDMLEVFDLTINEAYIMNGDPTLNFHYFATMADAENNVNEILTPTAAVVGSNVWIRVENNRTDFYGNHCYVLVEQTLTVNPLPNANLISNNTLNTVYVDNSDNVVQTLTLDAQLYANFTFQWDVDGVPIPGANSSVYIVDTASPTGANRVFTVSAQDIYTGCNATDSITVIQSTGTPSPLGLVIQGFNPGDTLADLNVSGSNILWYASASGKNSISTFSTPLPLNTLLVNETTYYASQTVGGIESIARLPVTVQALLGVPGNEIESLQFAPNPVKNSLTLQSAVILKSVTVYNLLGQKVFEQNYNDTTIAIDLSRLSVGNYILKAQGESGQKTIRIVKE